MYARIEETEFQGAPVLTVATRDGAQATIALNGGQVIHWQPAGGHPWLYLSERACLDGSSAIRGGIPVCFPQFAEQGPLPKHGLVRTRPWRLIEQRSESDLVMLTLGIGSDRETEALWPHAFDLELTLGVGANRLDVELAVSNVGESALSFTAALHTYLQVHEVELARLEGLKGKPYQDKRDGGTIKVEHLDALVVDDAVDRIYTDTRRPLRLLDGGRTLSIVHEQFPDTVVWNPWVEGAATLGDMPDRDFRHMLCVEAAVAASPVTLAPDESWWGRQSLIDERL
ncbi:D-hexose-6-phosphate mutarotase [Nitrogeniibacter mangrovi]|uniref:Putative glucose-6-phosphate 1-epimerase n=1 Tax=Nitrogeniibacter mangrovi TaxID=2016596 RepID=A0A6C1B4U3_9RHOO|nr:D-hexose-6-phosphate mutarotase [Nitrogeniibacter mangrovi]QID17788.1 D-hexose-6-phosphate mutarotase [Nitrogeniibacter mangrovi]